MNFELFEIFEIVEMSLLISIWFLFFTLIGKIFLDEMSMTNVLITPSVSKTYFCDIFSI